eukprot:1433455-Rhodomonas_salina.2
MKYHVAKTHSSHIQNVSVNTKKVLSCACGIGVSSAQRSWGRRARTTRSSPSGVARRRSAKIFDDKGLLMSESRERVVMWAGPAVIRQQHEPVLAHIPHQGRGRAREGGAFTPPPVLCLALFLSQRCHTH